MQMICFVSEMGQELSFLKAKLLEQNYQCVSTVNYDEIDQIGYQQGRVVLIFGGKKIPQSFLDGLKCIHPRFNILFLPALPQVLPQNMQQSLQSLKLQLFSPATMSKLLIELNRFFNEKNGSFSTDVDDIQFGIIEELKKEGR